MPSSLLRPLAVVAGALVAAGSVACGGSPDDSAGATGETNLTGTLTVLAAASLTDVFGELAEAFEAEHSGVDVDLSFDGSSRLAAQILEGAPADVFASADDANIATLTDADRTDGRPIAFASNRLVVVVPAGNPQGIADLADLTIAPRVALCQAAVPCGAYATEAFRRAGLAVPPAGSEENVKGVLTKVALGEADAGIVYATDVRGRDDVEAVTLPAEMQAEIRASAVALRDASNIAAARRFVDFLGSAEAQSVLREMGFGAP